MSGRSRQPKSQRPVGAPKDTEAYYQAITELLDTPDESGRTIGNYQYGVYAFFDFDGEPLYVGQTTEKIRVRLGRHLTGQRSDAVGKFVLDPGEIAYIEIYPLRELEAEVRSTARELTARAEYALVQRVLSTSVYGKLLNEKAIPPKLPYELPQPIRRQIITGQTFIEQRHPDVRLARRAANLARLAQMIRERRVDLGIRETLLAQTERIALIAQRRVAELKAAGAVEGMEQPGEETGEGDES